MGKANEKFDRVIIMLIVLCNVNRLFVVVVVAVDVGS